MEFKEYKLMDVVEVLNKTINPQKNKNTNFTLYSLPAFDNNKTPEICKGENINSNKIIIDREAILFNKLNIRFKRIWNLTSVDNNSICSTEFIPLVANQKIILNDYLYYLLILDEFNIELIESSTGTSNSHQRINKEILLDKTVYLPSIENQKKIIYILKNIDKKIELNNQINDNLYGIIQQLYINLYKDTEEWEEIELGSITKILSGKRPKEKSNNGHYPIIGANGIMGFTVHYNIFEDVIIMGRVGTLGIVKRYYNKIWASDNTLIIKTKYKNYVENYLKTIDYNLLNTGSTQPLLTQRDIKKQKIFFNENKILRFENISQKILDKIRNNDNRNQILEKLRDTLLTKLMNGEIDLENIQI